MKAIFILITALLINSKTPHTNKPQINEVSGNCSAVLSVEKNRSFKSAHTIAKFMLILKNTSYNTETYKLFAKNLKEPCNNKTIKSSETNMPLDISFELENSDSVQNEITLNSGQSNKFIIKVKVPKGTPYNNWGCIEIEAKPNNCISSNIKTILSVYVSGPSEE